MQWNVVVQLSSGHCDRLTLAGLPRPVRILIFPSDATAEPIARAAHQLLLTGLQSKSKSSLSCGGPINPGCMAEDEPACEHILVPVIGQAPISPAGILEIDDWLKKGRNYVVASAIAPGLDHSQVFAGAPRHISYLQILPWGSDPARLASLISQRALYGDRPGLFISYLRQEAAPVADQIFDEMTRRGFRVFLDRFSGSAGRFFPQEFAEELADRGVVLVLETPGIRKSRWTRWEIAFARSYRLGLLALQWPHAPTLPGFDARDQIVPTASGDLSKAALGEAAAFVERNHTLAALTRRAFYEALVESAAFSRNGSIRPAGDGVVELVTQQGASAGFVVPSGQPGSLAEVHRLARATNTTTPGKPRRLLAGQHEHLKPSARQDLEWLARTIGVDLSGRADVYQNVCALL